MLQLVPLPLPQPQPTEGCTAPGGFNCRYKPRWWIPSIIPESEITSRELSSLPTSYFIYANVVVATCLAINTAGTERVSVTWNTKLEIKRCPLSMSHTCVNAIDVVKSNTLLVLLRLDYSWYELRQDF
ncbi:hypothetical protein ACS0PU_004065 [Formica fusca]